MDSFWLIVAIVATVGASAAWGFFCFQLGKDRGMKEMVEYYQRTMR